MELPDSPPLGIAFGPDKADAAADVDHNLTVVILLDVVDVLEREVAVVGLDLAEGAVGAVEVDYAVVGADPHGSVAVKPY